MEDVMGENGGGGGGERGRSSELVVRVGRKVGSARVSQINPNQKKFCELAGVGRDSSEFGRKPTGVIGDS
jgi:hypothetical protein